jgi:hypothetical protein
MLCSVAVVASAPAAAQETRASMVAFDTAAAIDESVDTYGNYGTGLSLDGVLSIGMGRGVEAVVWPVVQRLSNGQWIHDVWIANLRYERAGRVGIRVDGGLIPAPVGLANLTVRRPHLNPLISQPMSLFTPLPQLEPGGPRASLLGGIYPYGGQVTLSGAHWDSRIGVIDTSPLRRRRILSRVNPPRFANVIVGGGITPFVGFRIGASATHGGWARAGESPTLLANQAATIVTVESEYSFRYTRLAGEWVRDVIETSGGNRTATGWYIQGQQTLAPRWFVAARVERMASPRVALPDLIEQQHSEGSEEVVGFRLTPEFTLRIGHRARRAFGRPDFDHQGIASVVWWRRWI